MNTDLLSGIKKIISDVSGIGDKEIGDGDGLFALGLDSLMASQVKQGIEKYWHVDFPVGEFFQRSSAVRDLADWLDQNTSSQPAPEQNGHANGSVNLPQISMTSTDTHDVSQDSVEWLMAKQLQTMSDLMTQQLSVLGGTDISVPHHTPTVNGSSSTHKKSADRAPINFRGIKLTPDEGLTEKQQKFVDDLIARFNVQTEKSKAYAQKHREGLADWITTLGYRHSLKEVTYPIVSARSDGSRFWDIDGNEYLDISMGYGASYFGHNPDFVKDAIATQLAEGMELAPQLDMAGEVADTIRELTGVERVAFANTGTEAVMAAIRIARAVTKRNKVVMFAGSYHGTFDGILAVEEGGHTFPLASGTMQGMVEDIEIVHYGTDEALNQIRDMASDVAAVLVEPVQSRRPDFQPKEFLHKLRALTTELDIALIFDEMITGFRIHPGGAQAHFDVQADLVTYGKAVAGGMPIGVVAGKAQYMDAIDGGGWQFGDDSAPVKDMTFFGGTFCKHPLTMAASRACLLHMKAHGAGLQNGVTQRTERLAQELNAFFDMAELPIRVNYFGGQFRLEGQGRYNSLLKPLEMDLLFLMLMEKGIYTWERRICFLSTAHTDEDVTRIVDTFTSCMRTLISVGFFPDASAECLSEDGIIRYAMTPGQQRMFLMSQFDGGEMTAHLSGAWTVEGDLDVDRLEKGFQHLVDRHEAMRTGFEVIDDALMQVVYPEVTFELVRLKNTDAESAIAELVRPFDHATPPLLRAGICEMDTNQHLLVIDVHHMALDGMALNILMRELMLFYAGEALPPVVTRYRKFAKRIEAFGNSETYREQEAFWHQTFDGDLPEVILPADFERPAQPNNKGGQVVETFSSKQLQTIAQKTGVSPNMVLLAAYYVWLYKITRQTDLIVGTATSGRGAGEEELVGMATHTVGLRIQLDAQTTFQSFLEAVKNNCLNAYAHADYPIEDLIRSLSLTRDAGRHPLIDVMYTYERADDRELAFEGIQVRPFPYEKKAFLFDLELDVIDQAGVVNLNFEYAASLFKRETIERFARYYKHILNTIAEDTNCRIADLSLLNEADTQAVLKLAQGPVVDVGDAQSIADLLEEQVAKTPNALAVSFGDVQLTYRELNARANGVAHYLIENYDIQPDDRVGVFLERSEWLPIGIWGILKSGACYVPMDTAYPVGRLEYILEDSACKTVVSEDSLAGLLAELKCTDWVNVRQATGSEENVKRHVEPDHLAFMTYTSGSTGKPKGVMVTHRNEIDFAANLTPIYGLSEGDTFFALTTPAFDISVVELVSSLCVGMHIYIASKKQADDPELIADEVQRLGISTVQMTPTRMQLVIHARGVDWLVKVDQIILGGEPLTETLAAILVELPHTRTFNSYGPTETTIYSTVWVLEKGQITIGTPMVNESIYILSNDLTLLPPGIEGEICIGGTGVGRGYANRDELTSERFLPNPFGEGRIYRSGDLGYWLPDGRIICSGRADFQVKVRGFRVELGEVESMLESQPNVQRAVVIVRNDELVAYLVGTEGLNVHQLREALSDTLPYYMIPSQFIRLSELPLMRSGKVDRQSLPEPTPEPTMEVLPSGAVYEAPEDALEQSLVNIWQQVLGNAHIGIQDNFFDLGGHSLKAAQIVARVQQQLGHQITIADLLSNPAIESLADAIRGKGENQIAAEEIPKLPEAETYALSHAQKRLWVLDQMMGTLPAYMMLDSFLLDGDLNVAAFEKSLQTLFDRHEILRTTFVVEDGEPRQKVYDHLPVTLEKVDLKNEADPESAARKQVDAEFVQAFDLKKGPLVRLKLLTLPDADGSKYVFVFCAHHIVFDGWSVEVFLTELKTLYQAYCTGNKNPLPSLKIQYRDYAAWQHDCLESDGFEAERAFWLEKLGEYVTQLDLPSDAPRQEQQAFAGETLIFKMDEDLTAQVNAYGMQKGHTLFMTLLSALDVLLYYYTSETDLVVGTASAGRDLTELEGQIGFYLNLVALRTTLSEEDQLTDVLEKIKETTMQALAHQAYPFDALVEDLGGHEDRSRHPLFDVMMFVQNQAETAFELDGVQISTFHTPMIGSKLDINMWFDEGSELTASVEYNTDLFEKKRMQTFWDDYCSVIDLLLNEPDLMLKDIRGRLMGDAEKDEQEAFLSSLSNVDDDF